MALSLLPSLLQWRFLWSHCWPSHQNTKPSIPHHNSIASALRQCRLLLSAARAMTTSC